MTPHNSPNLPNVLEAKARRAYEWGRLRSQLPWMGLALLPVALGLHLSRSLEATLALGTLLALLILFFRWRGQQFARGTIPGFLAGGLALAVPLFACSTGLCPAQPSPLLLLMCSAGGVMAGAVVTVRAISSQCCTLPFVLSAGSTAAMTASLTCAVAGISGVLGMVLGLALASSPALVMARAR